MVKLKQFPILAILLVFMLSISCNEKSSNLSDNVYNRVVKSGKIRCAYLPYPPATIKDPNTGNLSGIFVDVIIQVAKNTGFQIEWVEEVGWGTMIEGLQTNRYDIVVCAIWPNASRGVYSDFSVPLYYSGIGAYVRKNDNRFDNSLSFVNSPDVRISTLDGEINELIAITQFPDAQRVSLPQLSDFNQILYNVIQNKADITFVETYVANQFLEANPNTLKNIIPNEPIRVTPNCYLLKKGEFKFLTTINTALDELINTGYVDQIIDKYEKYSGSFYRINYPYKIN